MDEGMIDLSTRCKLVEWPNRGVFVRVDGDNIGAIQIAARHQAYGVWADGEFVKMVGRLEEAILLILAMQWRSRVRDGEALAASDTKFVF